MNTQRITFKWLAVLLVIALLSQFALILPRASAAQSPILGLGTPYFEQSSFQGVFTSGMPCV